MTVRTARGWLTALGMAWMVIWWLAGPAGVTRAPKRHARHASGQTADTSRSGPAIAQVVADDPDDRDDRVHPGPAPGTALPVKSLVVGLPADSVRLVLKAHWATLDPIPLRSRASLPRSDDPLVPS